MTDSPDKKALRSFGIVLFIGFIVIGTVPALIGWGSIRTWAYWVALVFGALGLLLPMVLRLPFRVWMAIGGVLGWVNTRILLTLIFFAIFTPVGSVMRIFGYDPLGRKADAASDSYLHERSQRDGSHMDHQY